MDQLPRVEKAWLEAARNGDVDQMKMLRKLHPQWLNLNRNVDEDTVTNGSDASQSSLPAGFCTWDGFHLSTIGASALHTATWHRDDKIVRYLLEEGQDPDTPDKSGMTAIMLTIMHHNLQATRCIFRDRIAIQRNLVVDCREEDEKRTRCTVSLIQLFIDFNANVDKKCQRGKTALHHATTDDTYEVARLLLSSGASVDAQDEEGMSPLHHCIQPTSLLVADLLLQHGANVHLPANDGVTPLQLVIRGHDVNVLQIILNHHVWVVTAEGEEFAGSVLMTAVDEGVRPIVKFLVEEEYTTTLHQNVRGETPMHRALLTRKAAVAKLLRSFHEQARVLALHTASGESCLHYAARYSTPEELHCLLRFYRRDETQGEVLALWNSVNSAGRTALFLAATSRSDSLDNRNAKTRLMVRVGAKLLGSSPFLETVADQRSIMALSVEVQTCLSLWLSECAETRFNEATQFCMEFLAIVYSLPHPRLQMNHEVIGVMLSSGQAVDTISLLLLLPFDRRASLALLELIGVFARQESHSLLLALYEELVAAWTGLVA
ncbi:hypothetical protein PI124_g21500 [Phytophthora idaei]|nr:hypothetical protein PI125_g23204 [Phytophthora idaei]KAG3128757.1 hypothetical protein PI126_g21253 [Phytophthora idaei]KAG3233425.1 hypothetical protein PI124_g21500 [Phytophthora idaei]